MILFATIVATIQFIGTDSIGVAGVNRQKFAGSKANENSKKLKVTKGTRVLAINTNGTANKNFLR